MQCPRSVNIFSAREPRRSAGLAVVYPFDIASDKLPDSVFVPLDERAGCNNRRRGKLETYLGQVGQFSESFLARDDSELGIKHSSIQGFGSERRQLLGHASDLNYRKVALPLERPFSFSIPQTKVSG